MNRRHERRYRGLHPNKHNAYFAGASAASAMAASAAAFLPSTLTGLVAWFKADTVTTLGGTVTAWPDSSASALTTSQSTGTTAPLSTAADTNFNSKPSVTFAGSNNKVMSSSGTVDLTAGYTIFTTFRLTGLKNFNGVFRYANSPTVSGDGIVMYIGNNAAFVWGQNDTVDWFTQGSANVSINTTYTYAVVCGATAGTRALRRNGAAETRSYSGTFSLPPTARKLHIGAGSQATPQLNGQIGEQIVYNRALVTADIQLVEAYLRQKYNNY